MEPARRTKKTILINTVSVTTGVRLCYEKKNINWFSNFELRRTYIMITNSGIQSANVYFIPKKCHDVVLVV